MPVISIRVDKRTYEALVKLADARGVSLYSFVKRLVEESASAEVSAQVSYQELERKLSELTSRVSSLEEKLNQLLSGTPQTRQTGEDLNNLKRLDSITTNTGNNPPQQVSTPTAQQKKGDACSWLEEKKVIAEGDIADRYDRNTRDRLFRKWKEMCKAEVIEGSSERVAVIPQLWEELQKKINMINSDSNELAKKMLDKEEYRLFRWLRDQGVLVFSNIEKRWKIIK
jgi:vacuolar-type H+-ATPase subunit I/STV1